MISQIVSHYRILEKLGQGGMSAVYKAEDLKLKRKIALNFVPPEARDDAGLSAGFCQEGAGCGRAVPCECLHRIYEIDEECGFLAMEYVGGETVQARVRLRPLPVPEALDIAT